MLAAGNTTAKNLAARLATEHKLTYIVYRDGARVPVQAWAEAATLAKSALADNAGPLNYTAEASIWHVEVFDRFDCGWLTHTNLDRANGTVRVVDDAVVLISHVRLP